MGRVHGETQGVGSRAHTSDMGRIIGVLVLLLALVVAVVSSSPLQKLTDGSGSCGKEGAVCSMLDSCPECSSSVAPSQCDPCVPHYSPLSMEQSPLSTESSVLSTHYIVPSTRSTEHSVPSTHCPALSTES